MVDYKSAIKRPFSDFRKLSIGAGIIAIPELFALMTLGVATAEVRASNSDYAFLFATMLLNILVTVLVLGYELNCANTARRKKLPEWKNLGGLMKKGLLGTIISLIYLAPFISLGIVVVMSSGVLDAMQATGAMAIISNLQVLAVLFLLFLIILYFAPMIAQHYADNFRFKDAFKLKSVIRKAFAGTYLVAWLFAISYSLGVGIVAGIVSYILEMTLVLPIAINAYVAITLGITLMTTYGQAYREV